MVLVEYIQCEFDQSDFAKLTYCIELRKFVKNIYIMNEIIFLIEQADEGGYTARALEYSVFTEADTLDELKEMIKDAIKCHFEKDSLPKIIRLHFVREEILSMNV